MNQTNLSRRGLLRTATWATPAVVVAGAAPAFATSPGQPGITPSISEEQVQDLIDQFGPILEGYRLDPDKFPRCISSGMAGIEIKFTATRDGVPVGANEEIKISLGGPFRFVGSTNPYVEKDSTSAVLLTNASGQVTLPAFWAVQSGGGPTGTIAATYGTASAGVPISIPVSTQVTACFIGQPVQ